MSWWKELACFVLALNFTAGDPFHIAAATMLTTLMIYLVKRTAARL